MSQQSEAKKTQSYQTNQCATEFRMCRNCAHLIEGKWNDPRMCNLGKFRVSKKDGMCNKFEYKK
jgi:hypothetical protein